ncbi:Predicted kinase, aminoglycoside phosphotransferase (APT) family [Nonomuraea solani]|uniref:Predicted kinase, aminoglycoside phosphotransferase (APT) family n=1 Tax=Nonomuraea solani TaxID=1144553 RepID=A0A1H6A6N2_9ACTN|nr:aminoglycoside phosphotransferase family protein [Nonomuraea solani]SEG44111.1 Predicted kinase, aminoglycoside phosphotransferase (APT) family [Nonomuraea solani]
MCLMEVAPAYRALVPEGATLHQGQFHQVVIGEDRVICLPRTEAAAARLPGRAALLRVLAGLDLGVDVPRPLREQAVGEPPYLILSRVPGAPLEAGVLTDPQVAEVVAGQYAGLLAGLAAAGERARAVLPVPRGRWGRFAAEVRAELYGLMSEAGRRRAERELAALDGLPDGGTAVVHGDLGPENVLWEYDGGMPRLSGVIDWDEVTIGDPAEDLAAIAAGHGQALLNRVIELGGLANGGLAARITTIRRTFALQQALAAHRDGDQDELADGLAGYVTPQADRAGG